MADMQTIYDSYVGAFASKDPDAVVRLHAADGTFWLQAGTRPVQGRTAIAQALGSVFAQWPEFGFEVPRVIFAGRHWVLDWAVTARLLRPGGSMRDIRFDALDLVEVDEHGLVSRKDTVVGSVQMRAALEG